MKATFRDVDYQRCVKNVGNSFDLILLASHRARELKNNGQSKNHVLSALLEVQDGKVTRDDLPKAVARKKKSTYNSRKDK